MIVTVIIGVAVRVARGSLVFVLVVMVMPMIGVRRVAM